MNHIYQKLIGSNYQMNILNNKELLNILGHIGFGFILNKENQPLKTKSGTSMYLDEFILQGFNEIEKYPYYENLEGDYKKIVIDNTLYGSLKIFDLHSNYKTDYQFDWDNILNAKGGTAPYIQNAYVRIDSILFKENAYLKYHELLNFNFTASCYL